MHNLLSKKAQFFVLTSVMIVGVFFTLSKYINQYSFVDTSKAVEGAEVFMFDNIKDKAIKTVQISNVTNVESRLTEYKNFVEKMVADRGYTIYFEFRNTTEIVNFNMTLISERYVLRSDFWTPIPTGTSYSCNDFCIDLGYSSGVCEQNPFGQCREINGDYQPEGDYHCTGGPEADTCCCFPAR